MGEAAARVLEGSLIPYVLLSLDIADTFAFAVSGASGARFSAPRRVSRCGWRRSATAFAFR
jgi:hypothetical protein